MNVASAPTLELSLTQEASTSDGSTVSSDESESFVRSLEVGYNFKAFGVSSSASAEVSASDAWSLKQEVQKTLTKESSTTFTTACGRNRSPTGQWFLFQWIIELPEDNYGPGLVVSTQSYACSASMTAEPRCPAGYCARLDSQICTAPYQHLSKKTPQKPTRKPTRKPVRKPTRKPVRKPTRKSVRKPN